MRRIARVLTRSHDLVVVAALQGVRHGGAHQGAHVLHNHVAWGRGAGRVRWKGLGEFVEWS